MDEGVLERVTQDIRDELDAGTARIFASAMRRTLERAVVPEADGTVFVLTGDIPAMWLRDSAAQMRPYLALAAEDPGLGDLLVGLVRRQSRAILHDPYANAFNRTPDGAGHQGDRTAMTPWTWERKYEVDSLAFPLQLAHQVWTTTGRTDHLDDAFRDALTLVIDTWIVEQDHESRSPYRFERTTCPPSDTLVREGRGNPVDRTGMTWSAFRPSDDACALNYNVPANLFAASALRGASDIAREVLGDGALAGRAERLSDELLDGVMRHGTVEHPGAGRIFACEVDGLGRHVLMDDANMPSLLSLPLTGGVDVTDPVYAATRAFVLSHENPTYQRGPHGAGIGSPHTPDRHIWPIALAVQGLTSTDDGERRRILARLGAVHATTGQMSESFHVEDPTRFTRTWFSWADSMYCELVLAVVGRRVAGSPGATPARTAAPSPS